MANKMAKTMLSIAGLLALAGLARAQDTQVAHNLSRADMQQLLELRKLGVEYYEEFQNITLNDLVPDTRLSTPADLLCAAHMAQLMQGLGSGQLWSWKMIDAWGSIPSGILLGNLKDLGNYDECIRIDKAFSTGSNIKGKYCFTELPVGQLLGELAGGLKGLKLKTAVCLPSSCSAANMDTSLKQLLKRILNVDYKGTLVQEKTCKTAEPRKLDGLAIFTIVLLSLLGLPVLLATLYDYFLCADEKQLPGVIKCFSARANSRALFRVDVSKNPNVITCLHGIRCLSLAWVIFGHDYIQGVVSPNINMLESKSWCETPYAMLIIHAVYSVDTFFFLSGLLVGLIALRAMKRAKGKLNVPLMYLHRYLRLTPVLGVAILIYLSLLVHMSDGPLWSNMDVTGYENCKDNWFWTLLYVQNYATKQLCLGHTWYLAVDMQLYIISPILIFALYKWGKKAVAAIVVLLLLLSACLFSKMVIKHYSMSFKNQEHPNSQQKIYFATETRAAPWLIGLIFGYFLYKTPGRSFKLNRLIVWTCWLTTLAIFFTCLFALYPDASWSSPTVPILNEAFYLTLTRIAWPLGLVWVVFACMQGYGGMANGFLSSPLWQPLSRLSYCAYIFHMFMLELNTSRTHTNTYFSNYEMMLRFWSDFGFTLILAYVMYIIVEAPLGSIQTLILPNRRPAPKEAPVLEIKQDLSAYIETPKTPLPELDVAPPTSTAS